MAGICLPKVFFKERKWFSASDIINIVGILFVTVCISTNVLIHSSKFLSEVNKRLEGSVRLCLSYEGLSSIQIPVPSLQKQYKIVNDVTSLIKKINIETKLLQKYKEQKKYLLSNMFI